MVNTKNFKKFETLLQEPDFDEKLEWVAKSELNRKTDDGKKFLTKLMPHFKDTTRALAWTISILLISWVCSRCDLDSFFVLLIK